MRRQRQLIEEVARRVQEEIGITARVRLVDPRTADPGGPPVRVVDER